MVGDALFMDINNKRESKVLFKCLILPDGIRGKLYKEVVLELSFQSREGG